MSSITGNRKSLIPYLLIAGFAIASMAMASQFASAQTTGNGTSTPTGNATCTAGGNATAAAAGNATMAAGNATAAMGGNSTAAGNATTTVTPFYEKNATLVLTPSSIKAGDQFTVTGSGYNNDQNATMMIDNDTLVTAAPIKTDSSGGFTATAISPMDITGGSHKVSATDATGVKASAMLTVTSVSTTPSGNATSTTPSGNATSTTGNVTA